MSTWRQKREMEELKKRDKAAYDRLMAAREKALGALGKFDSNLQDMRKHLAANPVLFLTTLCHGTDSKTVAHLILNYLSLNVFVEGWYAFTRRCDVW